MKNLWVVEVYNESYAGANDGQWEAWEDYCYETRQRARDGIKSHKASECWTKVRIRKYQRTTKD